MRRSIPLVVVLAAVSATFRTTLSEQPCDDIAGSCVLDKSCPDAATCRADRCVCQTGTCAVGGEGPILGKCVPVKASHAVPRQPLLSPESWFLSAEEILQSRQGHPRGHAGNIAAFTRGNQVHAFVEGKDFFAELYDEILTARAGDSFYGAGWLVGPYWQLRPELDMEGAQNTSFGSVLTDAAKRNVEILGLFWRNIKPQSDFAEYKEEDAFIKVMRDVSQARGPNASRVEAYMDARCKTPLGSIHQKFFTLSRKGQRYPKAWIGGLDIAEFRWDVIGSNSSYPAAHSIEQDALYKLRQAEAGTAPISPGWRTSTPGWHDCQLAIDGPAAVDIVSTFAERWNQPGCDLTSLRPLLQKPPLSIRPPEAASDKDATGSTAVQVLRTYGCSYAKESGCLSTLAPMGETSILAGILKAVRAARYFIYIEDQYFYWMEPLYDALRDALRNGVAHVILLVQWPQEVPGSTTWLWNMWHPLFQEFPDRVHGFYRKGGVYIHSKTKIFDDTYVMTGSANINYRSHTSDAEAVAAVVDEGEHVSTPEGFKVSAWAREFRCRLFEDHTGTPAADFHKLSIDDALKHWHDVASQNNSRIGSFHFDWANSAKENVPNFELWSDSHLVRQAVDPDDRCESEVKLEHTELIV